MPRYLYRRATAADFPAILTLNAESVRYLSPLDTERLTWLDSLAASHQVAVSRDDGTIAAFLLALRAGTAYDSPNYRWFAARYPRFTYVDRIVVAASARRDGLAGRLYDELIKLAVAAGDPLLACEIDDEPPNPASQRFHARYGFREVGQQWLNGGTKRVSLQIRLLDGA